MNICLFCGDTPEPLTEEDIWPRWVSRALRSPPFVDHFRHLRTEGPSTTSNWTARYIDVTTKAVCRPCNGEWLSTFENRDVSPIVRSMLFPGHRTSLSVAQQHTVAAWAYKMALLVDSRLLDSTGTQFFTAADRLEFRRTTSAHPFVRVMLANYEFGWHPAHAATPRITLTPRGWAGPTLDVKVSTITAGALAMQVMAVKAKQTGSLLPWQEADFVLSEEAAGTLRTIWPSSAPEEWPPQITMTAVALEEITAMWNQPTE